MKFVFHDREAYEGNPAGVTVSRNGELPNGDFGITEYCWGPTSLWFIDEEYFTKNERYEVYRTWMIMIGESSGGVTNE